MGIADALDLDALADAGVLVVAHAPADVDLSIGGILARAAISSVLFISGSLRLVGPSSIVEAVLPVEPPRGGVP